MNISFQTLRDLTLQLVPVDGSMNGNSALIAELQHYLPERSDAEYHAVKGVVVGDLFPERKVKHGKPQQ